MNIFKFISRKRTVFFIIGDVLLISFSVWLAFAVRFEGVISERYFTNIQNLILFSIIFTIPIFYFLKLYSFSWAYVSAGELISLLKAVSLSFLILTAFFFVLRDHPFFSGFPRSTILITYFFIFIFCGGLRLSKRFYLEIFPKGEKSEKARTLIVGYGRAG